MNWVPGITYEYQFVIRVRLISYVASLLSQLAKDP